MAFSLYGLRAGRCLHFRTFSWDAGERECHVCPTGAVCYGGSHVKAKQGFWRFNFTNGYYRFVGKGKKYGTTNKVTGSTTYDNTYTPSDHSSKEGFLWKKYKAVTPDEEEFGAPKVLTMTPGVCGVEPMGAGEEIDSTLKIYDGDGGSPFGYQIKRFRDGCSLLPCPSYEACRGDYKIPVKKKGQGSQFHVLHDQSKKIDLARQVPPTIEGSNTHVFTNTDYSSKKKYLSIEGYVHEIDYYSRKYVDENNNAKTMYLATNFTWDDNDVLETKEVYWVRPESCSGAYMGNLCRMCSPHHGRSSGPNCTPCPSVLWVTYAILACGAVGVIVFCAAMIYMQMGKEDFQNARLSIMMKILTSYLQLVSLFSAMELNWPTIMLDYFEYTGYIAKFSDRVINIECAAKAVKGKTTDQSDSGEETSIFHMKLLFFMLTPLWTLLACGGFWTYVYFRKKRALLKNPWTRERFEKAGLGPEISDGMIDKDEVKNVLFHLGEPSTTATIRDIVAFADMENNPVEYTKFLDVYIQAFKQKTFNNCVLSCIVLLFMLHPTVSNIAFLSLTCIPLGGGKRFLEEDLDVDCDSGTHIMWMCGVGLPGIIFFAFGIPYFGYKVLESNKDDLDKPHVQLKCKQGPPSILPLVSPLHLVSRFLV